jgi:hypothetical protein
VGWAKSTEVIEKMGDDGKTSRKTGVNVKKRRNTVESRELKVDG